MIPFEAENLQAYKLLLRIEIVLRECLRELFEAKYGRQWQRRLQGELLKKIRQSQADENRPHFNFIRLGPLYYLTFGELITQLRQASSRSIADQFGGDAFLKQLENVLLPRNAICHSRPVPAVGLQVIEALYAQMEVALTADKFARLLAAPDCGLDQVAVANALIAALTTNAASLHLLPKTLELPDLFLSAQNQYWWADETLAGFDVLRVDQAFRLIADYNALPKGIGSSAARQHFIQTNELETRFQEAIRELEQVTS
jgi:hypothetical protein